MPRRKNSEPGNECRRGKSTKSLKGKKFKDTKEVEEGNWGGPAGVSLQKEGFEKISAQEKEGFQKSSRLSLGETSNDSLGKMEKRPRLPAVLIKRGGSSAPFRRLD